MKTRFALFTVALLFSLNYIISKLGMREFAPLTFAWLRVAGAAVLLALFARGERLERADSRRLILFSILGVVINQTLFLSGLAFTTVQVAAILITSIPVFTLGAAIVLGREQATAARVGGIALACLGALLVVGGEGWHGTARSMAGAVMILVNCLSYALYLVVSKPHMARLSARAVVARMFSVGTLLMFPLAATSLSKEQWAAISPGAWLALVLVILGPTVAAYLLQAWALRHADSSEVAAYTYLQPVIASLLGWLVFAEEIRAIVAVAAVLIFAGVWLAGRKM
ncbi:MAG TPA: DMT family transporter [Thermoanaerobaculia bacterium]|jgi:drug/metabolite transporter (DMT)-like permease|nr:DMT family transporter [Thermoanaerobaculia bacterium]